MQSPWLVGTGAIAEYLGLSRGTTLKLIHSGELRVGRIANKYALHRLDADAHILFGLQYRRLTRPQKKILIDFREGFKCEKGNV